MVISPQNISQLRCNDFLGKAFTCECGRVHSINIEKILIENGAIKKIPQVLREFGYKKVFIMADQHTYKAAGQEVEKALRGRFIYQTLIYQRVNDLVPDEKAVGEFLIHYTPDTDVIISVGTGVLNDLAKFVSCKVQVPYIIVATAPSMDGYASDAAALIVDNVKISYPAKNAKAIIGDTSVLTSAPMSMIAAGLGDMLGKFSALHDWKLGSLIEREYYCETVVSLVKASVQRCIDSIDGLRQREDAAMQNLMEGLVLTGIAMSFAGSSRPASGAEHHLSHFWEMMYLLEGKAAVLHGTKVGIASMIISKLSEALASETVDFSESERKAGSFDPNAWKENIKAIYKDAAPGILKVHETTRNSYEDRLVRIAAIKENWDAIVHLLREGPSSLEMEGWLTQLGGPVRPSDLGMEQDLLYNALLYAKEVRIRYTILQLLWDIGLLENYARTAQI